MCFIEFFLKLKLCSILNLIVWKNRLVFSHNWRLTVIIYYFLNASKNHSNPCKLRLRLKQNDQITQIHAQHTTIILQVVFPSLHHVILILFVFDPLVVVPVLLGAKTNPGSKNVTIAMSLHGPSLHMMVKSGRMTLLHIGEFGRKAVNNTKKCNCMFFNLLFVIVTIGDKNS